MNYDEHRRNYVLGGLERAQLTEDPFELFRQWQDQAIAAGLKDPTAASLATVEPSGELWQRIVLMKGLADGGFLFYTNYESNKARALQQDDRAAMLFPWNELDRQVSVTGRVQQVSAETSDAYFTSRPRASQLGAWASAQSRAIASREALVQQFREVESRFEGGEVPRPPHWGGYCLAATRIEFWQGGEHRLHDRFRYTLGADGWEIERLQP